MPENIHKLYISLKKIILLRAESSILRECRGFDAVAATEGDVLQIAEPLSDVFNGLARYRRRIAQVQLSEARTRCAQLIHI